jgi:hypothetical protein
VFLLRRDGVNPVKEAIGCSVLNKLTKFEFNL